MKFRFCGGRDCPDWLGAEVSTLSRISALRIRVLAKKIVHHLATSAPFAFPSTASTSGSGHSSSAAFKDVITASGKLFSSSSDNDTSSELANVHAIVAVVHEVVAMAARYNVDAQHLALELQQLGLPREHSDAIAKPYGEGRKVVREALKGSQLKLDAARVTPSHEVVRDQGVVCVLGNEGKVQMSRSQLDQLVGELRDAQSIMQKIE